MLCRAVLRGTSCKISQGSLAEVPQRPTGLLVPIESLDSKVQYCSYALQRTVYCVVVLS